MKTKILNEEPARTIAIVFEPGDNVMVGLSKLVKELGISAGQISGVGAFKSAVVGFFDREQHDYQRIIVNEQVEVLAFAGVIALAGEEPKPHIHVVLGKSDGTAHGGHLLEAEVWPTLELILEELPGYLRRKFDAETNIPLIDLNA